MPLNPGMSSLSCRARRVPAQDRHANTNTGQNPPGIRGTLSRMTRPTARVLALLEILQAGGTRTTADLASRLDVDERTVRRYVDHLIDLDIPVRSVRGRYGGYRLAPGYRIPPLMLTDDEALAVLLGLVAGLRAGLVTTSATAMESAAAKIRRVLPEALGRRLDALLATADFTTAARPAATHETGVLLMLVEAARHRRPVAVSYTARDGRRSERTVYPYGIVVHSGRWYVTGADSASGEVRTFRLDRIETATVLPGSFEIPAGFDPAGPAGYCPGSPRCPTSTRCRYGSWARPSRSAPGSRPGSPPYRRSRPAPRRNPPCRPPVTCRSPSRHGPSPGRGRAASGCGSGCGPSGWSGSPPCSPGWTARS